MTVNLRDYLSRNERTYKYRIKAVVPLNNVVMDVVERLLAPYVPHKIGRVQRTIFHKNPLDFPNVTGAEVFSVDIELGLPISGYAIGMEICRALKIPEKFVIIRGENDPAEIETQRMNDDADMDAEAASQGLTKDALMNNPEYPEVDAKPGDAYYGDKYNGRLVGYMKKVEDERSKAAIKPPKPFEYLEKNDVEEAEDFNAGHEGLKPAKKGNDRPLETGPNGTLEDVRRLAKRLYRDQKGNTKAITK